MEIGFVETNSIEVGSVELGSLKVCLHEGAFVYLLSLIVRRRSEFGSQKGRLVGDLPRKG